MAQNLYGPGVRMGNWNEDVYLEEERMRDFLEKRDKGKLLIQRNRRMKRNLLRQLQLSISEDGYIHYGDKVMLVNPDYPAREEVGLFLRGDLSLCMTPDEMKAYLSDEFEVPCGLSAVQTKIPMGRNTFVVMSAGRDTTGQVLRYGQDFCLGIVGGFENKMLYLSSDHKTLLKSSKKSWLQEVYLTDKESHLNYWQAAFLDHQLRLEFEGFPIPANEKIIIYHRYTNRGLAAHRHLLLRYCVPGSIKMTHEHRAGAQCKDCPDTKTILFDGETLLKSLLLCRTYFGKEAEVAAHTHLDPHRVEKPKNYWMLVTGNPRNQLSTMLDLPTAPAEDTPPAEQAMGLTTQ